MQAHGASVARISLTQNSGYESIMETAAGIPVAMWRPQFASQSRAALRDA
jgi:hypothetical protein